MSTSTKPQRINRDTLLSTLPPPYPGDLRSQIKSLVSNQSLKIPLLIILDDDPTGTQTCHDIQVLMTWDVPTLTAAFTSSLTSTAGGFFILTNSRAMHEPDARALIKQITENLKQAGRDAGKEFEIVLRSDSTLRGHFPMEADVASEVLGEADLWVLAPFFLQGGRYTIDDVHYVDEEGILVPAGETQFAKDATFGYTESNLKDWVVEKTGGRIAREKVVGLGLEDVRRGGPEKVRELLERFEKGNVVIVNAAAESDMDVVVLGLLEASKKRKFLFRSGAALVSSRLGIAPIEPRTAAQLNLDEKVGGLIIAGSYVPKTTAQLEVLREKSGENLTSVVLDVGKLLESDASAEQIIKEAQTTAEQEINRGQDVLIMTSRKLVTGSDGKESLNIGSVVARALVSFLTGLKSKPRYVIAKGGITSSDMATKGLSMKIATVVGQAALGVPLWECLEDSSKWKGLP
ncbi:Putative four-carbon acid sugar kinase domain-containing protein [Septoria linicola]|uniref:Four-carbon acid sugar kinase domain-containing protein n=1 Tax=Septoria linicola TaxID=215465 RepID=A0A9Q9EL78_9PEZI|nr:Putative four-carbon acid sugar kinase domain-containing protein [Septoria linicola]